MPGFGDIVRSVRSTLEGGSLTDEERDHLARGVEEAARKERMPTLVLIGESGVGKSMTINALFNAGQEVGATRATTLEAVGMTVGVEDVRGSQGMLRVYDMPGLGDDIRNDAAYRELYRKVLRHADVVLWIHTAEDRTVANIQGTVMQLVARQPDLEQRLVFGLNKADVIDPGGWNTLGNVPSEAQLHNLAEREVDFSEKLRYALPSWTGQAIAYSALQRYQLTKLFKAMIQAVPERRRWVLESRMDLADFKELMDKGLLRTAEERSSIPVTEATTAPPSYLSLTTIATGEGEALEPGEPAEGGAPVDALAELPEVAYRWLVADRSRLIDYLQSGRIDDVN